MRRRNRGSVFVFTVVMVLLTTTLIVAASVLTGSTRSTEVRREKDAIALASFQGVLDQIKADSNSAVLNLPIVTNYTCGGQTWNVTVSDNSASLARSVLVTATATIGATNYSKTSVVVQRFTSNPLNYCFATNTLLNSVFTITTGSGGTNGDMYVNGPATFSVLGPSTVNGDLETTNSVILGNVTITGNTVKNATALTFPAVSAATYQSNATANYVSGTTLNNVSFPAPSGSTYPIFYVNGPGTLKGTVTGQGVIFFNGNLTVSKDVTYANGSSRVAVIVKGNITVSAQCKNLVGYWYATGSCTLQAVVLGSRTISSGAITGNSINNSAPLSITYDSDIFTYPSEGKKFCLPGFWP